jgi:DNA helicase-2/ATP-dependent DNA helicase PcrA
VEIKKQYLPKVAKFQPKRIKPSPEQLAIQLATQKTILIDANAGAAKTTTLALRIAESLARGVAPGQVLALCVTEAAQQVLRQRLKDIGVAALEVKKIRCETFEGLAQQLLLQIERVEVPYFADVAALGEVALDAMQNLSDHYGRRFELDTSTHNVALHTFFMMQIGIKARLALHSHDFSGYTEEEIAHVLRVPLTTYLWLLEYENLRDGQFRGFGDAAFDLVQLLMQQPDALAGLIDYRVIVADELHDLSEVTFRLLASLIQSSGAFFCGAGDKDQVIYSWQGADHQYLRHRFQTTFPNLATYPLTSCYRYGSALAQKVACFKAKPNQSGIQQPTRIDTMAYAPQQCAPVLLASLQAWLAQTKAGSAAILLRSPAQSIAIEQGLIEAGIAYQTEAMPPFLQRTEILMLRGMLALGLQNLDSVPSMAVREMLFDAMLMFAEISIGPAEWDNWQKDRAIAISQPNALEWFLDGVLIRRAKHSRQAILAARDYLRSLPADAPACEVLQQVGQLLRLNEVTRRVFVDPQQAAMVQESIAEFIELSRRLGLGMQAFCDWLGQASQAGQAEKGKGVVIACVDAIKGREYDAVFLPYLAERSFPRAGVARLEEENRFYVAITRTRSYLALLVPELAPSPFIAAMQGESRHAPQMHA